MSLKDVSLKCKNFKCFGDNMQGFDEIKPINVIIGGNNSGKTTLLDLVEYATKPTSGGLGEIRGHKGNAPQAFLSWQLKEKMIVEHVISGERKVGRRSWSVFPREWAIENLIGTEVLCELHDNGVVRISDVDGFRT